MGKVLLIRSEIAENWSINICLVKTKLDHHLASFLPRNTPILSEISLISSEIVPILPLFHQLFSCPDLYLASLKALIWGETKFGGPSLPPGGSIF
jgi:hypothetical protein